MYKYISFIVCPKKLDAYGYANILSQIVIFTSWTDTFYSSKIHYTAVAKSMMYAVPTEQVVIIQYSQYQHIVINLFTRNVKMFISNDAHFNFSGRLVTVSNSD